MRRFNKSGTRLTLINQVPHTFKDVEAIYFGSDFQQMVRSGNKGQTIVFQNEWDWFRALAHGNGKRWVEISVNNYLKDELKLTKVILANRILSTVNTKEHSLLRLGLRYHKTLVSSFKMKGNSSNATCSTESGFWRKPRDGYCFYLWRAM